MNSHNLFFIITFACAVNCLALSDSTTINHPLQKASIGMIKTYQAVSKIVPFEMCIFEPSCSGFAIDAIIKYGTLKGIQISANRIMRCNPSRKFEQNGRYVQIDGKLFDPIEDYNAPLRKFSVDFLLPGLFQFEKGEIFDGVLAVGFTGIPAFTLVNRDFKFNVSNVVFLLVGLIFYSGHINYCFTYPP